jgi:hypothetical protein
MVLASRYPNSEPKSPSPTARCFSSAASNRNHFPPSDKRMDVILDVFKPHVAALLALQMIEQGGQRHKLLHTAATPVGAVVHARLVPRRIQMHGQSVMGVELLVAQITLPGVAVPRMRRHFISRAVLGPLYLFRGDDVAAVTTADDGQDAFPVEGRGVGAG